MPLRLLPLQPRRDEVCGLHLRPRLFLHIQHPLPVLPALALALPRPAFAAG